MPYLTQRKLDNLLLAGMRMANACFNLKQLDRTPEQDKKLLADLQAGWDAAREDVMLKPKGAKR